MNNEQTMQAISNLLKDAVREYTMDKTQVTLDMLTPGSLWASKSKALYYSSTHGPIEIISHNNLFVRLILAGHGVDVVEHRYLLPWLRFPTFDDFKRWPAHVQEHYKELGKRLDPTNTVITQDDLDLIRGSILAEIDTVFQEYGIPCVTDRQLPSLFTAIESLITGHGCKIEDE